MTEHNFKTDIKNIDDKPHATKVNNEVSDNKNSITIENSIDFKVDKKDKKSINQSIFDKFKLSFPNLNDDKISELITQIKEKNVEINNLLPNIEDFPEKAQPILREILSQREKILEDIINEQKASVFLDKLYQNFYGNSNIFSTIRNVLQEKIKEIYGNSTNLTSRESINNTLWISNEIANQEKRYYDLMKEKSYSLYEKFAGWEQNSIDKLFEINKNSLSEAIKRGKSEYIQGFLSSKFLSHATSRVMDIIHYGGIYTIDQMSKEHGLNLYKNREYKTDDQETKEISFALGDINPHYASFNGRLQERSISGVFLYDVTDMIETGCSFYSADGYHIMPPSGKIDLSKLKFITDQKNLDLLRQYQDQNNLKTQIEDMLVVGNDGQVLTLQNDKQSSSGINQESLKPIYQSIQKSYQPTVKVDDLDIFPTGEFPIGLGGPTDTFIIKKK